MTDEESQISEEDMRALNSKESSILTSNLSSDDQLIPQQEILTDTTQLKTLGNLCESLVGSRKHCHVVPAGLSLKGFRSQ